MKKSLVIFGFLLTLSVFAFGKLFSTDLHITVIDDAGNYVEGAKVTLYKTMDDYNNGNPVADAETSDKKGRVRFKDLKPIEYYIYAQKGDMDNIFNGQKVNQLVEGKVNKINVIIE